MFMNLFKTVCSVHNKGIAHRDLKLDNFLVGNDGRIYIIDFGFAVPIQGLDNDGYIKGEYVGTINYMAPEIFLNQNYKAA